MSKVWGKIGAWAAEAELAEAEEREQAAAAAAAASAADSKSFPSLKDSVSTKQKKKTKMTLQEFTMQGAGLRRDSPGVTPDEMLRLPSGPKERSPEEMQYGRLGGGFLSYGRSGGPTGARTRDRDGDGHVSWGNNRRPYVEFEDDRRPPPPRASDFGQPSRADEVDKWASAKKPLPYFDSGRPNCYSSLPGDVTSGGVSRADETDNWAFNKKPLQLRTSNFSSVFRTTDRWRREEDQGWRPLVLDPPRGNDTSSEPGAKTTHKPNPFGAARPREEVLASKGLDWKKVDMEIDVKRNSSRSSSSHSNSSRPESAQSSRSEGSVGLQALEKTRPRVNPFGDAKPREVLLQEKGLDWRKIDLELEQRGFSRPEIESERALREEIDHFKRVHEEDSAMNGKNEPLHASGESQTSLHDLISLKERELDLLARDLDGKVRLVQKALERPGSGAGRVAAGFQERPPSRSGPIEDSRSFNFKERPWSRGIGDDWGRQTRLPW